MKKVILTLLALCCGNLAWAADWFFLTETQDKTLSVYIDLSSYSIEDNQIWVKFIFKQPEYINKQRVAYALLLRQADCNNRELRDIKDITYSAKGRVIYNATRYQPKEKVIPGSINEAIYQAVCKLQELDS